MKPTFKSSFFKAQEINHQILKELEPPESLLEIDHEELEMVEHGAKPSAARWASQKYQELEHRDQMFHISTKVNHRFYPSTIQATGNQDNATNVALRDKKREKPNSRNITSKISWCAREELFDKPALTPSLRMDLNREQRQRQTLTQNSSLGFLDRDGWPLGKKLRELCSSELSTPLKNSTSSKKNLEDCMSADHNLENLLARKVCSTIKHDDNFQVQARQSCQNLYSSNIELPHNPEHYNNIKNKEKYRETNPKNRPLDHVRYKMIRKLEELGHDLSYQETNFPGGKTQFVMDSGAMFSGYADGNIKYSDPNSKNYTVYFVNGDKLEYFGISGMQKYTFKDSGIVQIKTQNQDSPSNGNIQYLFPDGHVHTEYFDGSTETINPDGSTSVQLAD